ncbi:MAG: uncharacterized protein A8A55_1837 [Amphiamblys sp. WSBS2006]|nr:MAG: uncharacterized protein A8A55_1837 [Amphiamblys sp. WSBS2006]
MLSIRTNFASCGGILFFDRPEYIEITPNTTGKCFSDIEMELLDMKRQEILRDMKRRGIHVAPKHLEETTEQHRSEKNGTVQPRLVDSLVLTVAELSVGPVLLSPKTTAYLPTTGLSDALFFRLLEKTKIVFGGTVFLFNQVDGKDCIRERMRVECRDEVRFSLPVTENSLCFRENVARIPDKSIWLGKVKSLKLEKHAINLLPKLKLHEDSEIEELLLDAELGEYVSSILHAKEKSIWLGRVKSLGLKRYAANILPKLWLHEDNAMEELYLSALEEEHVSSILGAGDRSIWVGRVKEIVLHGFAANTLTKLRLHEDSEIEELWLSAGLRKSVSEILTTKDSSIWLGRVKRLKLERYAASTLPKLKLHEDNVLEELRLDAELKRYVSEIFDTGNSSIRVGRIINLELLGYAANLLPKLWLHEDNAMEEFYLSALFGEHVSSILGTGNGTIWLGRVKRLKLEEHVIDLLPKLKLHEGNVVEVLRLSAWERTYVFEILCARNSSIRVGRIINLELLGYAANILPKLWLHEDNAMEELYLGALEEEHVSSILGAGDRSIWLGRVKRLKLEWYAANTLTKLKLHADNVLEELWLNSWWKEYVFEILCARNSSIRVGRIINLKLLGYAVNLLPKLRLHEDSEIEKLRLSADRREHISKILTEKDSSIWPGKVKKLELELFAIYLLPKLWLHEDNGIEVLSLSMCFQRNISSIFGAKDKSIWVGKVKSLRLERYAVNILPLLKLHEDNVMEELRLGSTNRKSIFEALGAKDGTICVGRVKSLRLELYAINILPKLRLEDNMVDTLEIVNVGRDMLQKDSWILSKIKTAGKALKCLLPSNGDDTSGTIPADGGCCGWKIKQIKMENSTVLALRGIRSDKSGVLDRFEYTHQEEDASQWFRFRRVYLGEIKQNGLVVPQNIEKFLSYTLVDEEGNEVLGLNNPVH